MAKFSVCIRKKIQKLEYAHVYIRISHNSQTEYIKTSIQVRADQVKGMEVKDYHIISQLASTIAGYIDRLNKPGYSLLSVKEMKEILLRENEEVLFTSYFNEFIVQMSKDGRDNPADNYKTSFNSLKKFMGKEEILFSQITTKVIDGWIYSLRNTARAKQMYPSSIATIFRAGLKHYNDYDRGIIMIKNNPFMNIKIPSADMAFKRNVSIGDLSALFNSNPNEGREELAKDVSMLVFCLAGINVSDLYYMDKSCLRNWKLSYNRHKTKSVRKDKSYIEIMVPELIRPLFTKYASTDKLFNFSERYSDENNLVKGVNKGLESLCLALEINRITSYYLRHAWATIAQNQCGASTELVAFCLNHASAHKVTELYIVKDFSKIDTLNQQVIERIIDFKTVCSSVLSILVSLLEFRKRVNGVKSGSAHE